MSFPHVNSFRAYWDPPAAPLEWATIVVHLGGAFYYRRVPITGYVTQRLAAELIGISVVAVAYHVRRGTIASQQRGNVTVVPVADLVRYLERNPARMRVALEQSREVARELATAERERMPVAVG